MMNNTINLIKTCLLFILLICFTGGMDAQKFGDIDMRKLEETAHPLDPDASHAYIFKNCMVRYDFTGRSIRM